MRKLKVISTFSGGMGLDIGLGITGRYDLLACIEKDSSACKTIRRNKDRGLLPQNLLIIEEDIIDVDTNQLLKILNLAVGELDLLIGGPPCQSFSTAGKRGSIQDPRGTLLWQFLRFADELRPKMFLMENVRGLLSAALKHRPIANRPGRGGPPLSNEEKNGSVVECFAEDLQKIEGSPYHLDVFEVNAVNYGTPQIRERVLFIGNRYQTLVSFPDPTHVQYREEQKTTINQLSLFPENDESIKFPWTTLRDVIEDLEDEAYPEVLDFSPRKKNYMEQIPEGGNWRSLPVDIQMESMGKAWHAKGGRSGWWRRLTYDLPCPTLMTMPNHSSTSLCHPILTRALSVREYARIQEFPDDWEFCGTTNEKYRQIGNAVPIRLGKIAGQVIAHTLDEIESNNGEAKVKSLKVFRRIYIQSHVRTRKWYSNGQAVVWGKNPNEQYYTTSRTRCKVAPLSKMK